MSRPLPVPYTVAEAAEILRVKPYTVSKLCKAGTLKAHKPDLQWLIWPEDLHAYIEGRDSQDVA